ncbi:hypothetical protein CLU79DRAFT_768696 [Phycomyces nitens]|nr:hypothetical protein CLU79DRAFT_768696 [Phycomyces nitens]
MRHENPARTYSSTCMVDSTEESKAALSYKDQSLEGSLPSNSMAQPLDHKDTDPECPHAEISSQKTTSTLSLSHQDHQHTSSVQTAEQPQDTQQSSHRQSRIIVPAQEYLVKTIDWYNHDKKQPRTIRIVTQNENGPCPLVAICNVLLLREEITILPPDREMVTFEYLIERLGDYLLNHEPAEQTGHHDTPISSSLPLDKVCTDHDHDLKPSRLITRQSTAENVATYRYNLDSALSILPNLQTGLDVNIGFSSIRDFEPTEELAMFDLFGVDLVHGWVADPQDNQTFDLITKCGSYNSVVECIVQGDAISSELGHPDKQATLSPEAERSITQGLVAASFLQDTATQLTYYGLDLLMDSIPKNKLCVLFRNNHFSTLYKHPETEGLYTLVTDSGLVKERSFVWESLADIDQGASEFFDGIFNKPLLKSPQDDVRVSDMDLAIALSLEDQRNAENEFSHQDIMEPLKPVPAKESPKRASQLTVASSDSTKKKRQSCTIS